MGYAHISNLYKEQNILMFKECFAMEKIHGTSAHVKITPNDIIFFSGGEKHTNFVGLFNQEDLRTRYLALDPASTITYTLYGEAYGGKCQGMSYLYGKELKFVVFDVKVDDCWLSVLDAESVTKAFDLEFVDYVRIPATVEAIDHERDRDSVQCFRNKVDTSKLPEGKTLLREGVVLRPLMEMTGNNGSRICAKHKSDKFSERKTVQKIIDPAKLKVLTEANEIADEWVTEMRLEHVLDKLPQGIGMENIPDVIKAMLEDVMREAEGEIVDTKEARSAISKKTVGLFKQRIQNRLKPMVA